VLSALWSVDEMLAPIERAIRTDRVTALAAALARLDEAGAFDDPALFASPLPHRYARRPIACDPLGRFVVLAMSWAPAQSSPLHDHAGLWGAEIVVAGTMREKTFRLIERDGRDRYRFSPERERVAAKGEVGIVIPPLEYHEFGNAGDTPARTVHVYAGDLRRCRSYVAGEDGAWRARVAELPADA